MKQSEATEKTEESINLRKSFESKEALERLLKINSGGNKFSQVIENLGTTSCKRGKVYEALIYPYRKYFRLHSSSHSKPFSHVTKT